MREGLSFASLTVQWGRSSGRPMANDALPALPARGKITQFNAMDQIGRIKLDEGPEVRFGASACISCRPAEGLTVFVVAAEPHRLGGFRARIVNTTGQMDKDPLTVAQESYAEREKKRLEYLERKSVLEPQMRAALAELPR